MAKVAIRFDIDSHKCIRDGVPRLLELSNKHGVPFTFYLNAGRAISIQDTVKTMLKSKNNDENYTMLSAREKLGTFDYIYAALINPKMTQYKENIVAINSSICELGIHGGLNHSHWYMSADVWNSGKIEKELSTAIKRIRKIIPEYEIKGFAAPGFVTSEKVEQMVAKLGFRYSTDWHENGIKDIVSYENGLYSIGVNVCGEPGGIAFWEYAAASGWDDEKTLTEFMSIVEDNDKVLVFDHPYFAAMNKLELIDKTINKLIENGHEIVTVEKMIDR